MAGRRSKKPPKRSQEEYAPSSAPKGVPLPDPDTIRRVWGGPPHSETLDQFHERYEEQQNPIGLIYCVIYCANEKIPLPSWAIEALGAGFALHLRGMPLERALLEKSKKGGRHSQPRKREEERLRRLAAYAAVIVAERLGAKGMEKFNLAADIIEHSRVTENADLGWIQRTYHDLKRKDQEAWVVLSNPAIDIVSLDHFPSQDVQQLWTWVVMLSWWYLSAMRGYTSTPEPQDEPTDS